MRIEDKSFTLVVHYRAAPHAAEMCRRAADDAVRRADGGLHVQAGKIVFEIKPTGIDKGTAIANFLAEPAFSGRTAVFVGDDASDEDGFAVVNRLGGHTIRVGDGAGSAARRWVPAVSDVLDWLHGLTAAGGTGERSRRLGG